MTEWTSLFDLARIFDHLPETQFWIKDKEGRFLACSRSFAAHFGFSGFKELKGLTDFDVSSDPLAREYVADDRMVLASGKTIKDKLELVKERDGSLNWYSTTKVPLRDAHGAILGTAGITRKLRRVEEDGNPLRNLERAVTEIHSRYREAITIRELASKARMSMDSFERRFRDTFRETPLKYLNRIRMRAACGLLIHSEIPIGDVARQCGFSDQSYFAKRFYAHLRVRPLDYRRKFSSRKGLRDISA